MKRFTRTIESMSIWRPFLAIVALTGLLSPRSMAQGPETGQPNVIIVLTDDQGTLDMRAYGATDLETPQMDALAESGVRFTQFYAAAPLCSASRAGLLTGKYPLRAGVPENVSSEQGQAGMRTEEVTLAEVFRDAGYRTAHIGKWHLGFTPETMPNGQGFDYSFGHMGGCIDNYSHFFYWNGPNRHDLFRNGERIDETGSFFPELMVREAGDFMARNRDHPFLMYFALNMPHYPYQGYARWLERYAHLPYPRNLYAAFLSTQDEIIGNLMARLEELGLRGRTIVVFQSDHGHSVEIRAHGGGGYAGTFRGAKFSLFEGGLRVPASISWPGKIPASQVRNGLAHGTDWFATLADLAGIDLSHLDLDGKSLRGMIDQTEESPHEELHWHVGNGEQAQWAVRNGPWKLIGNPLDPTSEAPVHTVGRLWLSNLDMDPTERENFIGAHPEIAAGMLSRRLAWIRGQTERVVAE